MNSAGREARDLLDVLARRVHEYEPAPGGPLPVVDDLDERRRAALLQRPEALLLDRREAAGLVSRSWLRSARVGTRRLGVQLPGHDGGQQALGDGRIGRACREQVLGPHRLRRLGEHDRGAGLDEQVGGAAERGVGGDAAPGVRAPAFEAHDQLGDRDLLALLQLEFRGKSGRSRTHGVEGRGHATVLLDAEELDRPAGRTDLLHERLGDVRLATEAHEQRGAHVRVPADAGEHPTRHLEVVAHLRAAVLVGEERELGALTVEALHDGVGADHGGNHRDVVAHADRSVGATVAGERPAHQSTPTEMPRTSHRWKNRYIPITGSTLSVTAASRTGKSV